MQITLQAFKDYLKQVFGSMTIQDAKKHADFIKALYATKAFLVEKARA